MPRDQHYTLSNMWVLKDLHCDGGLPTVQINCWRSPVMGDKLNLTLLPIEVGSLKATVENPRSSVEKLSLTESVWEPTLG